MIEIPMIVAVFVLIFVFILLVIIAGVNVSNQESKPYESTLFESNIKTFNESEKAVARKLSDLPYEKYRVINSVLLRTDRGMTEIDHIVVSIFGIFVIETKGYK